MGVTTEVGPGTGLLRPEPSGRGPRLVLTSTPAEGLTGVHRTLAGMITDRVELPPLRSRRAELEELALGLVRELAPGTDLRLVPSVLEALASHTWPGNLHELRAVMAHVLTHRRAGDVTLADLPEEYRTITRVQRLSGRERAERDAIVAALREHRGNKARAARELGISRTTLYARIRALKICPP